MRNMNILLLCKSGQINEIYLQIFKRLKEKMITQVVSCREYLLQSNVELWRLM
jgi:hypothetical protein